MRPSRLVFAVVLPLAFLITWDEPARDALPAHRPGHARPEAARTAPRPDIVSRRTWRANEELVREPASSTHGVRAVFIHHTNQPNDYACSDVPRMLRTLEEDHVRRGWDDLGYNFVVDRCGTVYEGRAGGAHRSVEGAHTKGFNEHSLGIAALGTFDEGKKVPHAMLESIAALAAWKLEAGADPHGRTRMVSSSSESRFEKGSAAMFEVISGHRDAYATSCPGKALYGKLPEIRDAVARMRTHAGVRQPKPLATEAGRGHRGRTRPRH